MGGQTRLRTVVAAGYDTAIGERQPISHAISLMIACKRSRSDVEGEIAPRRKTVFAGDTGLRIMEPKPKRRDPVSAAVCGGWKMCGETLDRSRITLAIQPQ
jgi:hypothetical protein